MEVDIRANIPIDECLPVTGCSDNADERLGGSAANVDQLCLEAEHRLVHGHAAERDANGNAVRSRGSWQRRGRANGGNQQPRPASGIGDGLHRRRHGCRAGSAVVNEDFDAVQRCGDEQRLSRSGDEDDTGSTGSGLGSLPRPARTTWPGTNSAAQMSAATVSVTLQRAYNERLVMNSLPSQGAEPKGIV